MYCNEGRELAFKTVEQRVVDKSIGHGERGKKLARRVEKVEREVEWRFIKSGHQARCFIANFYNRRKRTQTNR